MMLILGANGQLGLEFKKILKEDAIYITRKECDLNDFEKLKTIITKIKPKFVFNSAAYTNVDLAEEEKEPAFRINTLLPEFLAKLSVSKNFKLISFSTDYVFDGHSNIAYKESEITSPLNYYGVTKSEGEARILQFSPQSLIIRTSWVYSKNGKNFIKTILKASKTNPVLRVVDDQIGSLTWAYDLAEVAIKARDLDGIYHFSNEGTCSWYDVAIELKKLSGFQSNIIPIKSDEFPSKAMRPKMGLLDKTKIRRALNLDPIHWSIRLENALEEIQQE